MFNPGPQASLQQQLMTGMAYGQQGMLAEQQGNLMGAAQMYDQAAGVIRQSIANAQSWNVFVPDGVHAALAEACACEARVLNAVGNGAMAWQCLNLALAELNQAIALNPGAAPYHLGAGTLLMSMGNLPEAERAFSTAAQLAPQDPTAQSMVMTVRSLRGAVGAPMSVPQAMPATPFAPVGTGAPAPGAQPQGGANWANTIKDVCGALDAVFKTMNNGMTTFDNAQNYFGE